MKHVKKAQQMIQGEVQIAAQADKAKQLEQTLIKFSDLLIASTSAQHDEINFWEPKTLAPYEPMVDKKFFAAQNTLCVNSANYIMASHQNKTTLTAWRWDKKEAFLRFPLKEELAVLKQTDAFNGAICIGGTKNTGKLYIWSAQNGQLLGEIEGAHYMGISDLDISSQGDLVATAGKDSKVKVWIMKDLMTNMQSQQAQLIDNQNNMQEQENSLCLVEFGDHQAEVTQVQFSQNNSNRLFSCSLDKLFKVYDIAAKCTLKNIQLQSPIYKMAVDNLESHVYLACENQNIYCYSLEISSSDQKSKQKKTLQHKKKVTAMCLTFDGQYLISGDQQGLIYIWNIGSQDFHQMTSNVTSPRNGQQQQSGTSSNIGAGVSSILNQKSELIGVGSQLLKTLELHKDRGAITNLVCIYRPLSLYGLTANMKAYEPMELKAFQKIYNQELENQNLLVNLRLDNYKSIENDQDNWLQSNIEEQEELDYIVRSSQRIMKPDASQQAKNLPISKLKSGGVSSIVTKEIIQGKGSQSKAALNNSKVSANGKQGTKEEEKEQEEEDDFIGMSEPNHSSVGQQSLTGLAQGGDIFMSEVDRYKEENKRLKRTLLERFQQTFE
eukprot:403370949